MKYLKVFTDFNLDIESLSYEEKGRLFEAMLAYAKDQTVLPLPGNERFNWGTAKKQIDAQQASYEHQCAVNRKNRSNDSSQVVTIRHDSSQEQEQEQEKEQEKEQEQNKRHKESKRFAPPTADQVREYCLENGYGVDPERFVNFYASKGWKVGNSQMKDWKAAVRNWEQRDKESNKKAQKNYEQRRIRNEGLNYLDLDADEDELLKDFKTPKSMSNAPEVRLIVPSTFPEALCIHVAIAPVSSVRSSSPSSSA